jgi:hypothetical protein
MRRVEWSVSKTDDKVYKITFSVKRMSKDVPAVLCLTDLHWDSEQCDRVTLKAHLDMALAENIPVIIGGDLFDVMQGRWDPRASQESLRPEHRGGRYFDSVISTAVEWFKPYKDILAVVAPGNHETSVAKRHDTNLISRFLEGIKAYGSPVEEGGYWGFVNLKFYDSHKHSKTLTLHYHHGYGGGGEITRGLIDNSRTRSMYQADIFISGHVHRRNADENVVLHTDSFGKLRKQNQLFLRCGAYKDELDGWHAEKGRAARPIGGWLINFRVWRNESSVMVVSPQAVTP